MFPRLATVVLAVAAIALAAAGAAGTAVCAIDGSPLAFLGAAIVVLAIGGLVVVTDTR